MFRLEEIEIIHGRAIESMCMNALFLIKCPSLGWTSGLRRPSISEDVARNTGLRPLYPERTALESPTRAPKNGTRNR